VVDSLGINTHFQYYSYGHAPDSQVFEILKARLVELGIKNIRDRTGNDPNIDISSFHRYSLKLRALSDSGIAVSLIGMSPEQNISFSDGLAELQKIELHKIGGTFRSKVFPGGIKIKKILGRNEYDNIFSGASTCPHDTRTIPSGLSWIERTRFCRGSDWVQQLIEYSRGLYQGVKSHSNADIRNIPVHGPPLVHVPLYESIGLTESMRPINQYLDNQTANLYDFIRPAGVRIFHREFPSRLDLFDQKRFDITEFGYYTEKSNPNDNSWQSEERQAWNTLVSYFDFIEHPKVDSVYIYELLSQEGFPTASNPMQGSFGLLNPNYEPKPVFYSLKNLLALFEDSASSFEPGSVNYRLTSPNFPPSPDGIKHSLYQRSDGRYFLVLRYLRTDPTNEPANIFRTINVNFEDLWNIDIIRPYISEFPLESYENSNGIQGLQIPDDIIILALSKNPTLDEPPGSGGPRLTPSCNSKYKVTFRRSRNKILIKGAKWVKIKNSNGKVLRNRTLNDESNRYSFKAPRTNRFFIETNCMLHKFKHQ